MNPTNIDDTPILRPLPSVLQEIAVNELNEVPERLVNDVLALRHWIHKQPHLRARTNDQILLAFLRGSKFSLERAKNKIDRFYSLKASLPEVFNARRRVDDKVVQEILHMGIILQIPLGNDSPSPCVTIIRAGAYDIKKFKFSDVILVGSMFGEVMMIEDDNSTVSGYLEIMDMDKISAAHLFHLQPDLLRKFSTFADEAMPMRQRGTHFINVPPPFERGFNSLKTFFPAKMINRITVSSNAEAIFQFVPRECLPLEYGGENGTIQDIINRMAKKLEKYRDYFLDDCNYGTDDKLRENNGVITNESSFGIDGSFRKLVID